MPLAQTLWSDFEKSNEIIKDDFSQISAKNQLFWQTQKYSASGEKSKT